MKGSGRFCPRNDQMKLDALFSDGIVFAEGKPVRIFGEGEGSASVRFCGRTADAVSRGGRWIAELPPVNAGGPYELEICLDGEITVLKDVYVGKVYLVAGQSNAEFRLCESDEPGSGYLDDPLLRNYFVARPWIENDTYGPDDGWRRAEKTAVGDWSAIAYLAGRAVRRTTGTAVGVISCYQGASIIESWLPERDAERFALPAEKLHIDHNYPDYAAWNKNGVIYEKMLSRILPFSYSGVIWYQGESDTTVYEGEIYDKELLCFIDAVRRGTYDPDLRFAVIQIADFDGRKTYDPEGWRAVQLAQERAVKEDKNSVLIVSADVCESSCIHPTKKTALSERAAAAFTEKNG